MVNNLPYLLALHRVNGLGPVRLKFLLDHFQDPKAAWEAAKNEWLKLRLPASVVDLWQEVKGKLDPDTYAQKVLGSGIKVLTIFDEGYPQSLKQIYDPPVVLYYKGGMPLGKGIAVVGTRKITGYGRLVTEKFAAFLAEAGLTVVSGLARGVDTVAHQASLAVKGQTIAVLGGGLNRIFPSENTALAEKIAGGFGAVVSEFPPDYQSLPGNFPARNRVISGLSLAVLVTEAAEDSGSLITAKDALEQGREVFAVPGPITSPTSQGTSVLIKQGARLVTSPGEILEELGIDQVQSAKLKVQSDIKLLPEEEKILRSLADGNKHLDEICRELNLPAPQVSAGLIKMEIKGLVKSLGGGNYVKAL